MVSLFTSFCLLRFKQYDFNHTANVDCIKTNNKYCCAHYPYSDAKNQLFLSRCSKCENPSRLQKNIQVVDKFFRSYKCIYMSWNLNQPLILFFSNGAIVSVELNCENNTLLKVEIDETLCGKLLPSRIVDVILCENIIYVSYAESKLSVVQINHESPNLMAKVLGRKRGKFVGFEPKFHNFDLCLHSPKHAERKLSSNKEKNLLIIWWKNSDDVWPWMPVAYLTDRLNLLIYSVNGCTFDLLYPVRVQNELLYAAFSKECSYKFFCLEESKKEKSIVTNICTYEIKEGNCQIVHSVQLPVNGPLIAFDWSSTEDKLIASDSTGLLFTYDIKSQYCSVSVYKLKYLPQHISWHPQTCIAVIVCGNNKIFCVDVALNLIDFQLCYNPNTQCDGVDISSFFSTKLSVQKVFWQKSYLNDTCLLFLDPEMSSFLLLKISLGYVSRLSISYLELISQYLKCSEIDKAKLIYSKLDWEFIGDLKFQCLSKIVNYLLRKPFNKEMECDLEYMLGSFYCCIDKIPKIVVGNLEPKMYHLTRRFFHRALRYNRFEKAWSLAVDLDSQDLFLDLYQIAKQKHENILAAVALRKAEQYDSHVIDSCSESGQSDTCSESVSSSDVDYQNRKFEKWTTFRKMYQDILDRISDNCDDLETDYQQTKDLEKSCAKLSLYPSQKIDSKQNVFSWKQSNCAVENVCNNLDATVTTSSSESMIRSSSKLSLMDISANKNSETSHFKRHSKYATTPFCNKDYNNMLHNKTASATSCQTGNLYTPISDFSTVANEDSHKKKCSVNVSNNVSEARFDSVNHSLHCVSKELIDLNHSLIEKPLSPPSTSKKKMHFSVSSNRSDSFGKTFCDSSNYNYSRLAKKYEINNSSDVSLYSFNSTIGELSNNTNLSKLLLPSEHFFYQENNKESSCECEESVGSDQIPFFTNEKVSGLFAAETTPVLNSDCLHSNPSQPYDNYNAFNHQFLHSPSNSLSHNCSEEVLKSLCFEPAESLSSVAIKPCKIMPPVFSSAGSFQPALDCNFIKPDLQSVTSQILSEKSVSLDHLFDDSLQVQQLFIEDACKDSIRSDLSNSQGNFRNSSMSSFDFQALEGERSSCNYLYQSDKLSCSSMYNKNSKQSLCAINNISTSAKSSACGDFYSLSSNVCNEHHTSKEYSNENYVTEEDSEEMGGTKIKLDHLGII